MTSNIVEFSVCKDLYCRNGGKCAGSNAVWCACQPGFTGAFCHKSEKYLKMVWRYMLNKIFKKLLTSKRKGNEVVQLSWIINLRMSTMIITTYWFSFTGKCAKKPCLNGGTCIGENVCKCPPPYSGAQCTRKRLGTKDNPAPNAQAILDAGDSVGSGMYWIQPPGETAPAQTYCDMTFAGGAWMLASYGYIHTTRTNNQQT